MKRKPGSLFGGALLITGSCVGAGMLGLPVLTGLAGFFPALCMFFLAWGFMTLTALLLVEAGSWFPHRTNLLSIVSFSLGKNGKIVCWITYLFLFYALLTAYISATGSLVSSFFLEFFNIGIPPELGSICLVVIFGGVVYAGTRTVDLWNRVLMAAKIVFFLILVNIGAKYVRSDLLLQNQPARAVFALPILIISFGFHNMIPTLVDYMHGNAKRVKQAILLGSLFAFVIYVIWEILVLGIVPVEGENGLLAAFRLDKEGAQALSSVLHLPSIGIVAQGLAFFAILTSFLAQALSLMHFLSDGLKLSTRKQESPTVCFLTMTPPLVLTLLYPKLFFLALDFAGGICAVALFGVLPALIVFRGRKKHRPDHSYTVRGGNTLLWILSAFSIAIFLFEIAFLFRIVTPEGFL